MCESAATRMRLVLVIDSLGGGGAERVMATLAETWCKKGHDVTLVTIAPASASFYEIAPEIRYVPLGLSSVSLSLLDTARNNLRKVRALRETIQGARPDCVVSFTDKTNLQVLLSLLGKRIPTVVSERIDPTQRWIGAVLEGLRGLLYPTASVLVVQTERVAVWGKRVMRRKPVIVIPNPALRRPVSGEAAGCTVPPGSRLIVGMGRLTHQKGFDLLLRAFAKVAHESPGWSVVILGEGEARAQLESLADELAIGKRVSFPGQLTHPEALLRQAEIFVLPSRFEGFPNALLEAMAQGCAVISADCPSGPAEIVVSGQNGLLVPPQDVAKLAEALSSLMGDEGTRKRLGRSAVDVLERYSLERCIDLWEGALHQAVYSHVH